MRVRSASCGEYMMYMSRLWQTGSCRNVVFVELYQRPLLVEPCVIARIIMEECVQPVKPHPIKNFRRLSFHFSSFQKKQLMFSPAGTLHVRVLGEEAGEFCVLYQRAFI